MPASIAVRPADRLAVVTLTGSITGDEIASTAVALSGRPDWAPHYRVLWDASRVTELAVAPKAFQLLLDQERRFRAAGEDGELVFVVTDEVWAGLLTLFTRKMREDARTLTAVPTLADAYAHLGVNEG